MSTDLTSDAPVNRESFLNQLPQRIAAIEENWSDLSHDQWSPDLLDRLYSRIREISEFSARFELLQLNKSVFAVEVYLSSFVGALESPAHEQFEAIEGLLGNLKSIASNTVQITKAAIKGNSLIYVLSDETEEISRLSEKLHKRGAEIHLFDEASALLHSMDVHLPRIIIANTNQLAHISVLTDELQRLKTETSQEIRLVFVSTSNAMQFRVDAIRAGSSAYYVSPFDSEEIIQQIMALASPEKARAYRILIVEDDPTQAEFASSLMRKAGMQARILSEPMSIIETLHDFKPDLILMDIYMPEINGIEMTSIIREYNEFIGIPIIFLSGEQDVDKQLDAISVGGDDFIAKPIRPKHLLTVVENRIQRSRQLLNTLGSRVPHDRMTGLLTRQVFLDRIAELLESNPTHDQPAGVIVLSPDELELHYQALGVGGVDQLITELSQVIRTELKNNDAAARLDDDSIGLLIKRTDRNQIEKLCEHLHNSVSKSTFRPAGKNVALSIGQGLCLIGKNIDDAAGMVTRAKNALQQAHLAGKSQSCTHTPASKNILPNIKNEDDITATIRDCLENDGFVVQYQPMLNLQTRGSESYEIILLMPTPNGDLIGERQLREPARQANLLADMDRWLMERAISMLKKRRASGRQTQVFVRQSAITATASNLPSWLLGRLRSQQMVGTGLVLDFRISDLSGDIKTAYKNIATLREMDVEVSLSHFPNKPPAFKALRYVKAQYIAIAPQLLKVDRDAISSIIQQCHNAGAKVIVSNIDNPRSIDLHWSSGADYLQGNFIQRPLDNMDYDFAQVVI